MSDDLTPEAAALVRAGRSAFRPTDSDRERVLHSLTGALGESAALGAANNAGPANAAAPSRVALKTWLSGGVAAVALGTGVMVAPHLWTRAPSGVKSAPAVAAAPVTETMPSVSAPSSEITSAPEPPRTVQGMSSPRPGSPSAPRLAPLDSLPQEVRLLSRAEQQMNDGLAGDALRTLAEHERRFPNGALAEERMAARVQALCALGRTTDAKSELTRLTHAYPRSPHLERARRVCGVDVSGAP